MDQKKKIILIIIIISIIGIAAFLLNSFNQGEAKFSGEHDILILCTDPSEPRPGIGAVDMTFVIHLSNGKMGEITPVYPGGLYHPTLEPDPGLRAEGLNQVFLHDSLWSSDLEKGTKIAQEIVEYHTNLTTDIVVVFTPNGIDSLIDAVRPVYSNGKEVKTSSIDFLREDQKNQGATRGDAIEGLADGIKEAAIKNNKKPALIQAAIGQYYTGNIQVVPQKDVTDFIIYVAIKNLF
ncbi:MAG: DUF4012 domain-containing protein [Methanosphaera stadtmanae]|nr:DUF4012 domain-containing protein [Methanosphaera stadtmanae]